MQKTSNRLALAFLSLLLGIVAQGQTLTPGQLLQIHQSPDFASITAKLEDRGFTFEDKQTDASNQVTTARWYFKTFARAGEEVSSFISKSIDANQKAQTRLYLYTPFNYRDFITNLKKDGYTFKEVSFIDGICYYLFEKKNSVFLTAEWLHDSQKPFFEIRLGNP